MAAVRSCKLLKRRCEATTNEVGMESTSSKAEKQTCEVIGFIALLIDPIAGTFMFCLDVLTTIFLLAGGIVSAPCVSSIL